MEANSETTEPRPWMESDVGQLARELHERGEAMRKPPLCADCGERQSDPPSKLCPGCEAYREHQR
jgi:predicted Zn-ribbon and HTH transcriptional regulator